MIHSEIPFRCNLILQLIEHREGLSPVQLYDLMKDSYGAERQCTVKGIDDQMMSIKSVGLVRIRETIADEQDELVSIYQITDYGLARAKKYIGEFMK